MKIKEHAPLVARREIFIQAPPEAVWKVHTDIAAWSRWHPDISRAELKGPLAIGSTFRWRTGGANINSTLQIVDPNKVVGWTGKALGVQARHVWTLTADGSGTRLTTQESMEGWLARIMSLVMPNMLERSLDAWLQGLKNRVEGTAGAPA